MLESRIRRATRQTIHVAPGAMRRERCRRAYGAKCSQARAAGVYQPAAASAGPRVMSHVLQAFEGLPRTPEIVRLWNRPAGKCGRRWYTRG